MGILLMVAILIFSIILHEIAHGWTALKFGDDTAKQAGRLTLDPIPHIDLFGSIILPMFCFMMGGLLFGWAKPVPVHFERLQPRRLGIACVSLAGIAVNLGMALAAAWLFRIIGPQNLLAPMLYFAVLINVVLAMFNLMPIPPLDGSKLWMMWLSRETQMQIESRAIFFFVLFFMLLPYLPIFRWVSLIVNILTGVELPTSGSII